MAVILALRKLVYLLQVCSFADCSRSASSASSHIPRTCSWPGVPTPLPPPRSVPIGPRGRSPLPQPFSPSASSLQAPPLHTKFFQLFGLASPSVSPASPTTPSPIRQPNSSNRPPAPTSRLLFKHTASLQPSTSSPPALQPSPAPQPTNTISSAHQNTSPSANQLPCHQPSPTHQLPISALAYHPTIPPATSLPAHQPSIPPGHKPTSPQAPIFPARPPNLQRISPPAHQPTSPALQPTSTISPAHQATPPARPPAL